MKWQYITDFPLYYITVEGKVISLKYGNEK
jgi:hypothetical protein